MSQPYSGGRKRLIDAFEEEASSSSVAGNKRVKVGSNVGPLKGVVACLSGLTSDKKSKLHSLIEGLGGSYTRVFDLDKNTHLITEQPQGAKFELAMSCPEIFIVTPAWLEASAKNGIRMTERDFTVRRVDNRKPPPQSSKRREAATTSSTSVKSTSLLSQIESLLNNEMEMRSLFECQKFLLLGFDDDVELKKRVGKLIRRGLGTIYWEMNEETTMIIMNDTCGDAIRKAADLATTQHPKLPHTVSPFWVVESWQQNQLALPSKFPPILSPKPAAKKVVTPTESVAASKLGEASSVFRGSLFVLARVAPPSWAVDFDSKEQESFIKRHSGQILTSKLLDILRADQRRGNDSRKRRCHVVCWGSQPKIELNPILSTIRRQNLCNIVLVTPFWLQACVKAERRLRPDRLPLVFSPQPWPLRKIVDRNVSIAMTGFHWIERMALVQVIHAIGGTFHENMKTSSTHLVCKEKATGLKREKAIQWGLHIVTIDWLYHIVQYGYEGEEKAKDGCESTFTCR